MIVDANVAIHWCVETPLTAEAQAIAARLDLCAPNLLRSEAANGLIKFARGKFIERQQAIDGLELIARTISTFVDERSLLAQAIGLSLDLSHPLYDCVYLTLASNRGEPLATGDRRLATLAKTVGVRAVLIGPR